MSESREINFGFSRELLGGFLPDKLKSHEGLSDVMERIRIEKVASRTHNDDCSDVKVAIN